MDHSGGLTCVRHAILSYSCRALGVSRSGRVRTERHWMGERVLASWLLSGDAYPASPERMSYRHPSAGNILASTEERVLYPLGPKLDRHPSAFPPSYTERRGSLIKRAAQTHAPEATSRLGSTPFCHTSSGQHLDSRRLVYYFSTPSTVRVAVREIMSSGFSGPGYEVRIRRPPVEGSPWGKGASGANSERIWRS